MIQMILTDLDHTLLREDGCISEETLQTLSECRKKGIQLAIATARYWIGAERYIELLKPDYEITTDGTLLHAQDKCVYSCAFSVEATNAIIREILGEKPDAEITVADEKTVYWNSAHITESEKLHKAVFCDYTSDLNVQANKIVAELPNETLARKISEKLRCKLQCYRGENWYAFLPEGSGKVAAIQALAKVSGIPLEKFAAFGDDRNDMEMLQLCGTGVAVANALPEVLEAADEVTVSNEEDGVARWLKTHCLNVENNTARQQNARCLNEGKMIMDSNLPCASLLDRFVEASRQILQENLLGIYLHGSAVMGCFNPLKSDWDLRIVVQEPIADEVKRAYMDLILALDAEAPAKGIEMSVVTRDVCNPFVYPTPFDLHYSRAHTVWYRTNPEDYIQKMKGTDKDLAAHFTVIRSRGRCLYGLPVDVVFGEVPESDYLDSIWYDICDAEEDITENAMYLTLNLARVLAYQKEKQVLSKKEGGTWGLQHLPEAYHPLIAMALKEYETGASVPYDLELAKRYAGYMLEQISILRE